MKEEQDAIPIRWIAPECVKVVPEFSLKTDIWAFGCLMYEVFNNGLKPFHEEKEELKILRAIKNMKLPKQTNLPEHLKEVQNTIWVKRPSDRPTFEQIAHQLMKTFPPFTWEDLQKCQVNNIPNVKRVRMPNLEPLEDIDVDVPSSAKLVRSTHSQGKKIHSSVDSNEEIKSGRTKRKKSQAGRRRVMIRSKYSSTSGNRSITKGKK